MIWKRFHDTAEPVFRGQLEMDVANDLEQGIAKMKNSKYDAIILDLKFQGKGADDTITFISEHSEDKNMPPIIVLTGDEDIFVRRRAMLAGASGFWTKIDAQDRPDLFFKAVYNQYLKRLKETGYVG